MGPVTYVAAASSVGLVLMTGLYLDKRDDYAEAVQSCNADKLASVLDAERITHSAELANAKRLAEDLQREARSEARAREIAEEAARQAASRPAVVRTVIREVASENACISTAVPDTVLDSLRAD